MLPTFGLGGRHHPFRGDFEGGWERPIHLQEFTLANSPHRTENSHGLRGREPVVIAALTSALQAASPRKSARSPPPPPPPAEDCSCPLQAPMKQDTIILSTLVSGGSVLKAGAAFLKNESNLLALQ